MRTGNKPFFEIGFMLMDLADPAYWSYEFDWQRFGAYRQRGWSAPPKDYGKWHDLVYHTVGTWRPAIISCPDWLRVYAAIKARDGLELYEDRKEIEPVNGQWSHRFTLPAHGISLVELVPLE